MPTCCLQKHLLNSVACHQYLVSEDAANNDDKEVVAARELYFLRQQQPRQRPWMPCPCPKSSVGGGTILPLLFGPAVGVEAAAARVSSTASVTGGSRKDGGSDGGGSVSATKAETADHEPSCLLTSPSRAGRSTVISNGFAGGPALRALQPRQQSPTIKTPLSIEIEEAELLVEKLQNAVGDLTKVRGGDLYPSREDSRRGRGGAQVEEGEGHR